VFFSKAVQANNPRFGITEDPDDSVVGTKAREAVGIPQPPESS